METRETLTRSSGAQSPVLPKSHGMFVLPSACVSEAEITLDRLADEKTSQM